MMGRVSITAWIKRLISRRLICLNEFCHHCGRKQPLVWWCQSDALWKRVSGETNGAGVLCPICFDRLAKQKSIYLRWVVYQEGEMHYEPPTAPCDTCGKPTTYVLSNRCNNCWEVEHRLGDYLRSIRGFDHIRRLLKDSQAGSDLRKVYVLSYREEVVAGRCSKIVGIFDQKIDAHREAESICSTAENRASFRNNFTTYPVPCNVSLDHFLVEGLEVFRGAPLLDDWADGKPDGWDYEAVLRNNQVTVAWSDTVMDGHGNIRHAPETAGWDFSWKYGAIYIGQTSETVARKAAALFVSLWLMGVSASFCDKLMSGFITYLERQEGKSLTFLAEIDHTSGGVPFYRVTREGFCHRESFAFDAGRKIVEALGQPADDEEIIVTFTKRKKQ